MKKDLTDELMELTYNKEPAQDFTAWKKGIKEYPFDCDEDANYGSMKHLTKKESIRDELPKLKLYQLRMSYAKNCPSQRRQRRYLQEPSGIQAKSSEQIPMYGGCTQPLHGSPLFDTIEKFLAHSSRQPK